MHPQLSIHPKSIASHQIRISNQFLNHRLCPQPRISKPHQQTIEPPSHKHSIPASYHYSNNTLDHEVINQDRLINLDELSHNNKENKMRIRRVQSSGTKRRLPKDFFSRQSHKSLKCGKNSKQTLMKEDEIIDKESRLIYKDSHQKYPLISSYPQQPDSPHQQTPKFKEKVHENQSQSKFPKTEKKNKEVKTSLRGSFDPKKNNQIQFTVSKKKYQQYLNKHQSSKRIQQPQERTENVQYPKIQFFENTFAKVPLDQLVYNETFGVHQQRLIGNENKKSTLDKGIQKENMPIRKRSSSHKKARISIRDRDTLQMLQKKTGYFNEKLMINK